MEQLYASYGGPDTPDYYYTLAPRTFAPRLLAAIRADQRAAHGEEGKLDSDSICDCQDDGGLHVTRIAIQPLADDKAVASVSFVLGSMGEFKQHVLLDLINVHRRWLISDIHSGDMPSMLAYLENPNSPW